MVYLKSFKLPSGDIEYGMLLEQAETYNSVYPLKIFPNKEFEYIDFESITIFYGGNGSGKTTILKLIAESVNAGKRNIIKNSELFDKYVDYCSDYAKLMNRAECKEIKYIASEDVFDYLLDLKAINSGINRRKEDLINEYYEYKNTNTDVIRFDIDDYDNIKKEADAKKMTASKYVRTRLKKNNIIEESNGETALGFWQGEIKDHALYIIDEPENSLSGENQIKLKKFIEESANFFNCQFIIATHSPFMLALENAKIYDLDSTPVDTKKWTELENVKVYHKFFKEHEKEFKD